MSNSEPKWASAPGATILKILSSRSLTIDDLADALQIGDPQTRRLLDGDISVDETLAIRLSNFLGSTPRFWASRESDYRTSLSLLDADALAERSPVEEMINRGWIGNVAGWEDRAQALLDFYGVASTNDLTNLWKTRFADARFRTSSAYASDDLAVTAWLRQVEIEACDQTISQWRKSDLHAMLPDLQRLSRIGDPEKFLTPLRALLNGAGVALVVLPATQGNRLSGVAFKATDGRRIIGLTARHLAEDHFWFTLVHEIGHLVLHDGERSFFDNLDVADDLSASETEANEFGQTALLPRGVGEFRSSRVTTRSVISYAARQKVSPGVVVGQLHHSQVIRQNQFRSLIRRFRWDGATLKSARS
ncbi:ImmA/IrrE family metallo-endopeptidase [Clavibacter sp. Sh2088]|uniref:ImmA/IrrE family metallo-endopeptidase n=1 Tax=Clavibacter sp. Sh2088 TaxID=3397676 RepID=UPI0039E0A460